MHELISLNINAKQITLFKLDGPALRLKRNFEATRWFPLRKLRQVCITGQLATGQETLFKLAEKRIPVTLFTSQGELRCQLLHPHSPTVDFTQLLEETTYDVRLKSVRKQWFINSQLHVYGKVGINKGDVKLANATFEQQLGEILNKLKIRTPFEEALLWMDGIAQVNIHSIMDEEIKILHGSLRSELTEQMLQITTPLIKRTALSWIIENQGTEVTPINLHRSLGKLERALRPWFNRFLYSLKLSLEQADYCPLLSD